MGSKALVCKNIVKEKKKGFKRAVDVPARRCVQE